MPIQPNKDNLITYSSLQGDRRSFTGDQRKDDYINKQLLTGKWGYDESSGGLSRLKAPINVSKGEKTLGKSDYYESGYNLNEEELTQSYIEGTNKSQRAKDSYLNSGHDAITNFAPFQAAAYMTPAGMGVGAMQGATHLLPDAYKFAKDPSWRNAASVGIDALMMAPGVPGAVRGLHKPFKDARKILKEVDGYANFENSYASSMLSNSMDNVSPLSRKLVDIAMKNGNKHPTINNYLREEAHSLNTSNSPFSRWFENRSRKDFIQSTIPPYQEVPLSTLASKGVYNNMASKVENLQRTWKGATVGNNPLVNSVKGKFNYPEFGNGIPQLGRQLPFPKATTISEHYKNLQAFKDKGGLNPNTYLKNAEPRMVGDITGVDMTSGLSVKGNARLNYIEKSLHEVKNIPAGSKFAENSISADAFLLQQSQLSKYSKDFNITQGAGYMHTNGIGQNAAKKYWLKQRGKTNKDVAKFTDEAERLTREIETAPGSTWESASAALKDMNSKAPQWYKDFLKAESKQEFLGAGSDLVVASGKPLWHKDFAKEYVKTANKITARQSKILNQGLPKTKIGADGNIYIPRMEMVRKGGSAEVLANRVRPVEELKTNVQVNAAKIGFGGFAATEIYSHMKPKKKEEYKKGGWFQSSKAGRGVRDVARLSVNSALNPIEGLVGTDFGFDEKYGYSNDWAKTASKVTEGVGSTIGGVANAYVNTIVPGAGAALNQVGSSLEASGVTQGQDGPGAIGKDIGQVAGIFMGGEPPISAEDGMKMKKYGTGGKADLEAEGGELVLTQGGIPNATNNNASMTKLGDGAFKINGNSHGKGGVDMEMPNGESIIINKDDAPLAQKYIKYLETAKKDSQSGDFITKATGDLNVTKYTKALEGVVASQQAKNGNKSNVMKAKYGSKFNKYNHGGEFSGEEDQDRIHSRPSKGVSFLNNAFNPKKFYGVGEEYTIPAEIDLPEGISSSMYGLGFDPQSIPGNEAGAYSNMDRSVSRPRIDIEGNFSGRQNSHLGSTFNRNRSYRDGGKYMKAYDGMTYNPDENMTLSEPRPNGYSQGHDQQISVPGAMDFASFGGGNVDQVQAMGNTAPAPGQQVDNESSIGVFSDYANGAAYSTGPFPEEMPEGYTTPDNYNITGYPPAKTEGGNNRGGRFDKLKEMFKGKGLSDFAPYASSAYNIGMGAAGIINPAEGLDPEKYTTDKLKDPKRIDPYAHTASMNQMSATYMNNESDPRRRQAYASAAASGVSKAFSEVDYVNSQRQYQTDTANVDIDKGNNQMRLGIKEYNTKLAAAPYEFLKEGFSQVADTSLALEGNETLKSMSGTANYEMGQYIQGLSPQEKVAFGKLLKEHS